MGIGLAVASVIIGGVGLKKQSDANKAAKEAQKDAYRLQQAQVREERKARALQETRARRSTIRQSMIARAQAMATAQSAGGFGGSGVAGGLGSGSSRLGSALGFSSQMGGITSNIENIQGRILGTQTAMQNAQGLAQQGQFLQGIGSWGLQTFGSSLFPQQTPPVNGGYNSPL